MPGRLFGAKPLPETMMTCWSAGPLGTNFSEFEITTQTLFFKELRVEHVQNVDHHVQASSCWNKCRDVDAADTGIL